MSDDFDFGLLVCRIADLSGSAHAFWLYKVDHVAPEVGAGQREVEDGEEVLWYFQDTSRGVNTGDELVVEAPARIAAVACRGRARNAEPEPPGGGIVGLSTGRW